MECVKCGQTPTTVVTITKGSTTVRAALCARCSKPIDQLMDKGETVHLKGRGLNGMIRG